MEQPVTTYRHLSRVLGTLMDLPATAVQKRARRPSINLILLVLSASALVILLWSEQDSFGQARARPRQSETPAVTVGEPAPDFELPKLTITTDADDNPIGLISETDTVRLSSFRGKKPVCLIMSSYT